MSDIALARAWRCAGTAAAQLEGNDEGIEVEFLGRNGSPERPAAMMRTKLSGKVGAGLDPCAAMMVPFELADGQEREIIFLIGSGRDTQDAQNLIQRFRGSTAARQAQEGVWHYWNRALGTVYI